MPRGEKSSYSKKQHRHAQHAEAGSERQNIGRSESNRRAGDSLDREYGGFRKIGHQRRRHTGFD